MTCIYVFLTAKMTLRVTEEGAAEDDDEEAVVKEEPTMPSGRRRGRPSQ